MRTLIGLVLLAFPLTACGGSSETSDRPEADASSIEAAEVVAPEGLQIVQVTVEGNAYLFSPTSVQAGKLVRLVFDPAGLPGCSKDVVVPDFEISKVISDGDATIEFTPETQGPIAIACSMDMYRGTLLVE
jgi:plastocyanin domain-containing protein